MASSNFDRAFGAVIAHEGGYVDHPKDPGGATNLGVTIGTLSGWLGRPATKAEVRALTRQSVKPIYRKNYWDSVRGDDLPSGVDYAVFDFAVNSGPKRAADFLQRVVGVSIDGRIGPQTLSAVNSRAASQVVTRLCDNRLSWLKTLGTWPTFGRGWERRVNEVKAKALSWIGTTANPSPTPPPRPAPEPSQPTGANPYLVVAFIIAAAIAYFILKSIGVVP